MVFIWMMIYRTLFSLGGVEPALRDTIFLLRTDKSSYTITIDYNPNAGTKSSNCLSVMPAGSYPAMRALK